jgi:hypothetical protein
MFIDKYPEYKYTAITLILQIIVDIFFIFFVFPHYNLTFVETN